MSTVFRYRRKEISDTQVIFIQDLIAAHPEASRRALSKILCEAWNWVQPNGALRDMVCRSLMLEMHRADLITLPPVRCRPPNNAIRRSKAPQQAIDQTPLEEHLASLRPLNFRQVRRTDQEGLFHQLLADHHYLGYTRPVGEHLKYIVFAKDRPIACFGWSSAPRHLGPRDRFIGWSPDSRIRNIRFIAYNTRFLILPWVKVPHLASHLLGCMARNLSRDWQRVYHHPIYFLETFIDPGRFQGTCYKAANWTLMGLTTGLGKDSVSKTPNRSIKQILGYPLSKRFRSQLATPA